MNQKIRNFVLKHTISRELFFLVFHKKVNKKRIDKKIKKLRAIPAREKIDVIVSLTSYDARLNELQYTLYSLVTQTVSPEKIIVNLAEQDFVNLPPRLRSFEQFGVEYRQTEDLKSYKKLIPTLQAYPEKCIVTADDDLFYPKRWLEKLWRAHLEEPNVVVCHLTAQIAFENGSLLSYRAWKFNKKETVASFQNLILSGGGALFPPHSLHNDVCRADIFMALCPFADDLWDYVMALLRGTKTKQIADSYVNVKYVNPYREYGLENGATLAQINVGYDKNDEQLQAILKHYALTEHLLCEKLFWWWGGGGVICIVFLDCFLESVERRNSIASCGVIAA